MRTYTHPDVLTIGVAEGWADPQTDPTRIDWAARLADAAIPFKIVDGRPVNPAAPTGIRYGRNELGHWGEARAADALAVASDRAGGQHVVMVERADGHGWALPGGMLDPGEEPARAAVRELAEETGLAVDGVAPVPLVTRHVPDPRESDEAWVVTTLVRVDLGLCDPLPAVTGADDAARAEWIHADTYTELVGQLRIRLAGEVFAAHRDVLAEALPAR